MKNRIIEIFKECYGNNENVNVYFAPGRVNLIGEHTDYNGGHVFPCALTIGTYAGVRVREDNIIRLYSDNFASFGVLEISLDDIKYKKEYNWCNYPIGVIWSLKKHEVDIDRGMDIVYYGNIPAGAGLSSSASIEVLTAYFILKEMCIKKDNVWIAKLGQYSENNFNGMHCGIMDQFASAMGKKDNAIFLDTATLKYEYAPVALTDKKIVIMNTNKNHSLTDSQYNDRRNECETALANLKKKLNIDSLGELSEEMFNENCNLVSNPVARKRAKHAVYENQRTIKAVKALKDNDIKLFGELMVQSHISLRDDYEVSCEELDVLVEESLKENGVWGVRMTGGGFGGCCVSIIDSCCVDTVIKNVGKAYEDRIGYTADFYVVSIGDGVCRL